MLRSLQLRYVLPYCFGQDAVWFPGLKSRARGSKLCPPASCLSTCHVSPRPPSPARGLPCASFCFWSRSCLTRSLSCSRWQGRPAVQPSSQRWVRPQTESEWEASHCSHGSCSGRTPRVNWLLLDNPRLGEEDKGIEFLKVFVSIIALSLVSWRLRARDMSSAQWVNQQQDAELQNETRWHHHCAAPWLPLRASWLLSPASQRPSRLSWTNPTRAKSWLKIPRPSSKTSRFGLHEWDVPSKHPGRRSSQAPYLTRAALPPSARPRAPATPEPRRAPTQLSVGLGGPTSTDLQTSWQASLEGLMISVFSPPPASGSEGMLKASFQAGSFTS